MLRRTSGSGGMNIINKRKRSQDGSVRALLCLHFPNRDSHLSFGTTKCVHPSLRFIIITTMVCITNVDTIINRLGCESFFADFLSGD